MNDTAKIHKKVEIESNCSFLYYELHFIQNFISTAHVYVMFSWVFCKLKRKIFFVFLMK